MKIETINELLIDVIGKASKISTKNPNQPILENVLLEVVDEATLRVTSYNLDIFYTQEINNNTDPNNILVSTKRIEVKWCE